MRVTAIINLKGGVAKTTTTINMAAILARAGARVLLIDADSQCNCTEFFGADESYGNLAGILRIDPMRHPNPYGFAAGCIQRTAYDRLDILPGEDSLMDLDLSKVESGNISINIIRRMLENLSSNYDFCLVDCPPAFNAASAAALVAADDAIIPIKLDAFSLRGMGNMMRQILNMQRINPRLRVAGVLPTMWYRADQIKACEDQMQKSGLNVYPHIRRSDRVDDMTYRQEPLLITSPNSAAGVDYRRFVAAYVAQESNGQYHI